MDAFSSCGCLISPGSFFFQAEDGIRDVAVTGVQTCALPISTPTPAMFSVSLGGVNPRPRTCLGTIAHAAPPAATSVRNTRREISFFLLISIFSKDSLSRIGEGDIRSERDHAEAGRDTLGTVETHTALKFALKRSGKGDYEKIGGGIELNG